MFNNDQKRLIFARCLLMVPLAYSLWIIYLCVNYIWHGYTKLATDYLGRSNCLYRYEFWMRDFFTEQVKHAGNYYAVTAICAALLVLLWLVHVWKSWRPGMVDTSFLKSHALQVGFLLLVTLGLSLYGFVKSASSYDEVFSAVNCAQARPVQTLSYYMLPNNHILFNFLNNVLFHSVTDKVATGRIISIAAQLLFAVLLYWWLFQKLGHRGYALLYTTLLLLQFPVWGFSFQARGYALYLLCAFASAISLEQYLACRKNRWLLLHSLAVFVGFGVIPSFLMWYIPLIIIALAYIIYNRTLDLKLIRALAVTGFFVFLFYVPAILYSGLSAFTDNPYVRNLHLSWPELQHMLADKLNSTIQYSFGGDVDARNVLYIFLFLLPFAAALFLRRTKANTALAANLLIWIVFILFQLKFGRYPFMRNMIAHVSISLLALLLTLHYSLKWLTSLTKVRWLLPVGASVFCLVAATHFVRFMHAHMDDCLYFYNTRERLEAVNKHLSLIPQDARVWTSDECFYFRYLLQNRGTPVSHCLSADQQYYIRHKDDMLPAAVPSELHPVDSMLDYTVYLR